MTAVRRSTSLRAGVLAALLTLTALYMTIMALCMGRIQESTAAAAAGERPIGLLLPGNKRRARRNQQQEQEHKQQQLQQQQHAKVVSIKKGENSKKNNKGVFAANEKIIAADDVDHGDNSPKNGHAANSKIQTKPHKPPNSLIQTKKNFQGAAVKKSGKAALSAMVEAKEEGDRLQRLERKEARPSNVDDDVDDDDDAEKPEKPLLSCLEFGGPEDPSEMIYWKRQTPPSEDLQFVQDPKYMGRQNFLTVEPDAGQWNNRRMAFESAVAIAIMTNRTLVLPPVDLPRRGPAFAFQDALTLQGVRTITMRKFLTEYGKETKVMGGPISTVDWDGKDATRLYMYLRNSMHVASPLWRFDQCVVGLGQMERMKRLFQQAKALRVDKDKPQKPLPVDAPPEERLAYTIGHRTGEICTYSQASFRKQVLHLRSDPASGARLLAPFYAMAFCEDYRLDLHVKRAIRDGVRYNDRLQCAAARIVRAIRAEHSAVYDALHVRRNDFTTVYPFATATAEETYATLRDVLLPADNNNTIYIATDEADPEYFAPLAKRYNLLFLGDFEHLTRDVPPYEMPMLDQLVASRARVFAGAFYSTFTSYINRLRGYHFGTMEGTTPSYYYVPTYMKMQEQAYYAVHYPAWAREFPMGWRDIDATNSQYEAVEVHMTKEE